MNPDYARKRFLPKWTDSTWYRKPILPPNTSPDERTKMPFEELPERTLAQLGLRTQRRYGISPAAWRRRWGDVAV